jgi:hypothetical protein
MSEDPFKSALDAALAAKKPTFTDEQYRSAVKMLARSAVDNAADRTRLIEALTALGMEDPQKAAEGLVADAEAQLAAIVASVRPSVSETTHSRPAVSDGSKQSGRHYGPRPFDPVLSDRPATTATLNGVPVDVEAAAQRQRATWEAERYRSQRQAQYTDPLLKGLNWLRGK